MPLWNEIEGQTLTSNTDGQSLPLHALLRTEGRTAWFSTTDAHGEPGVISLYEALNDEETEQARLEAAARIRHPNLLTLRSVGTTTLDDESLVYVVMEPYAQTLAEVLQERTLTTDEARDIAESLLGALEAVEAAGMHHGHVDAAGVLAVGEGIKLRAACLSTRRAESDAPALAALLYTSLTGRRFSSERDAIQLPAPFATLVRAGTGPSGSLAAMRRVLSGPSVGSAAAPAVAAAPANERAVQIPATARRDADGPAPSVGIPRAALATGETEKRKRPGVAIAAVVLMVILLVIFWYAFRRPPGHTPISGEAPSAGAMTPASSAEPTPEPVKPAAEKNAAEQQAAAMGAPEGSAPASPASSSPAAPAVPSAAGTNSRDHWHVVAYTYNREEAADRKAKQLAERYPQLEPQVYSPSGGAPYLVALGGAMNRDDAMARRDAARRAGLPPDTYAQNYRH